MGTRVYTEAICDRCGERNVREGADGRTPELWSMLTDVFTFDGSAAIDRPPMVLCPSCRQEFQAFMRGEKTQ